MNHKKVCPNCFWKNSCSFLGLKEKDCKDFTTKEELIKKGYLPVEKK